MNVQLTVVFYITGLNYTAIGLALTLFLMQCIFRLSLSSSIHHHKQGSKDCEGPMGK